MKKVLVTVYDFDELSKSCQEHIKEQIASELIDENFDVFNYFAKYDILADKYGIEGDVYYSLAYQQEDGLHFVTEDLLTPAIQKLILAKETEYPIQKLFDYFKLYGYRVLIKHTNNRYEYASKSDVQFPDVDTTDFALEANISDSLAEDTCYFVENAIRDIYLTICAELEKLGYKSYDVSDDDVLEFARSQQYYADGRIYFSEE